jgi:hypothetical protein
MSEGSQPRPRRRFSRRELVYASVVAALLLVVLVVAALYVWSRGSSLQSFYVLP